MLSSHEMDVIFVNSPLHVSPSYARLGRSGGGMMAATSKEVCRGHLAGLLDGLMEVEIMPHGQVDEAKHVDKTLEVESVSAECATLCAHGISGQMFLSSPLCASKPK